MKIKGSQRWTALALTAALVSSMIAPVLADPQQDPPQQAGEVSVVFVTAEEFSILVGNSETIRAEVRVDGQKDESKTEALRFSPAEGSSSAIAEVKDLHESNSGSATVKGLSVGEVTVQAVYQDPAPDGKAYKALCKVKVTPVEVTGVRIQQKMQTIEVTDRTKLVAEVSPPHATDPSITWTSDKASVASVDAQGFVTGVSPGTATITATAGKFSDTSDITVSGLKLPDSFSLLVGQSNTLEHALYGHAKGKEITWSSSNISVAGVKDGQVNAHNPGTATITARAGDYETSCTVTVKEDMAAAITARMTVGEAFCFRDIESELRRLATEQTGKTLQYLNGVTVATNEGILYYGYSSPDVPGSGVGGTDRFYVSGSSTQKKLQDVYFVPKSDFGGTAIIYYTGYTTGNVSYKGTIRISVENSGDVAYNTAEERNLPFDSEDFETVCRQKTGRTLRYVTFGLPSESVGKLYFDYNTAGQFSQPVAEGTRYYVSGGNILLSAVSFQPAKGFSGTVTIPYQGTDSAGSTYNGKITITVYRNQNDDRAEDISYQTAAGYPVRFNSSDFDSACRKELGATLNYVYFQLPSKAEGTLYYNYQSNGTNGGELRENTRYFRSSSPQISMVDFVPAADYNGTVRIPYTGYASTGERFSGTVQIKVIGEAKTVRYSTGYGRPITFDGLDFNEACISSNGASLNYITFDTPSSYYGSLRYNYVSSKSTGSAVRSTTRYSKSDLSRITFVPTDGVTGQIRIPFSGYDVNQVRFTGAVEITIDSRIWEDTIRYETESGGIVHFRVADFDRIGNYASGQQVDSVSFTVPSSRYGRMYYNYNEERGTGSTVSSNASFYRSGSSRLIEDIVFVADKNNTGTVEIPFLARTVGGQEIEGKISITVDAKNVAPVTMTGSSTPISFYGSDFARACSAGLSYPLSYIEFLSVPSSIYGKLMLDYTGPHTGTAVQTGQRYYVNATPAIDQLSFIAKAGYQGPVSLRYKAFDTRGNTMEGTATIQISDAFLRPHFNDLRGFGWAAPSIEFLYESDIIRGSGGKYYPKDNTSRGDYALILYNLFGFRPQNGTGFQDVPKDSYYAEAINALKVLGIVGGNGNSFYPKRSISRQDAFVMLMRAMEVKGWPLQYGSTALLDLHPDGNQVESYARSAMASMLQMGVIQGDNQGRLNPKAPITRAEVAVVLHKILTR